MTVTRRQYCGEAGGDALHRADVGAERRAWRGRRVARRAQGPGGRRRLSDWAALGLEEGKGNDRPERKKEKERRARPGKIRPKLNLRFLKFFFLFPLFLNSYF